MICVGSSWKNSMAFCHYMKEWETHQILEEKCRENAIALLIKKIMECKNFEDFIPQDIDEKILVLRSDW